MSTLPVRDAYEAVADQYVAMVEGGWPDDHGDTDLVLRHLLGLGGPVLDLGCGPGHWSGRLHDRGARVIGMDVAPSFLAHARARHPGPAYVNGSMTDLPLADRSVAGVLSWYSTIHLEPSSLDAVLAGLHRALEPGGPLVLGFFTTPDDEVGPFDHRVITAHRWPVGVMAERLARAGFVELERRQYELPERPDRLYAAIAARAV